jgi:cytoskeletal protein CcmA (bactofilin family)
MAAAGSVIFASTVVRGNVRGSGGLEIHGRVEGDVAIDGDVVLGEGSAVKGSISGTQITISGAVQGDVRGREAVLIERGGRVVGDLLAPRIGIEPGGLVRGSVRTEGEPELAAPRRLGALAARPVTRVAAAPVMSRNEVSAARVEAKPERNAEARVADRPAISHAAPEKTDGKAPPPPPVVPSLPKGARGKKKKSKER